MYPRPNATELRLIVVGLMNKLTTIPYNKSDSPGYSRMVKQDQSYTLKMGTLWVNWTNRGSICVDNPNWLPTKLKLIEAMFEANKRVYSSEWNMSRVIINALNKVVPRD
jgi:hypothetical protein